MTLGSTASADIISGAGTLELLNNITVTPFPGINTSVAATITGNLRITSGAAATRTYTVNDGPAEVELLVSALISDDGVNAGAVTKAGAGRMTFSGNNTYSGTTTVNAGGVLRIEHANALGNSGSNTTTTVAAGGALEINLVGAQNVLNEILSITGSGIINGPTTAQLTTVLGTGGLRVLDGDVTFSQNVTLGATTLINVNTGDKLTFEGAGVLAAGGNNIIKSGGGTWQLGGTVANTGTGTWFINDGLVELNKSGAAIAVPATLRIGDLLGADNSAEVRYVSGAGTDQIGNIAVTVLRDGLLNLNGVSDTISNTVFLEVGPTTSGDILTGAGTLTHGVAGTTSVLINAGTTPASLAATIQGNLDFATVLRTFDVREGSAPVELDVQAAIAATAGSLTKALRGTLVLSTAAKQYTGTTTVNADAGTLLVNSSTAAGSAVTLTGSTVPGSTLGGVGTIGGTVTANNGTTINPGLNSGDLTGTLTINGALTFNGGSTLFVDLDGPAAADHDRVVAGAAVTVNAGSVLAGSVGPAVNGTGSFLVINKTSAGAIAGVGFLNALPPPTGTTNIAGKVFNYAYNDAVLGDGNDFVLGATSAQRIWDGGSAHNDFWTTPENWVGDVAPFNGDALLFPETINEAQRIQYLATGGTFTITFGTVPPVTTGNIAFNATPATVQAAVEAWAPWRERTSRSSCSRRP
jgi:autotransporter-associated beta strand protein